MGGKERTALGNHDRDRGGEEMRGERGIGGHLPTVSEGPLFKEMEKRPGKGKLEKKGGDFQTTSERLSRKDSGNQQKRGCEAW